MSNEEHDMRLYPEWYSSVCRFGHPVNDKGCQVDGVDYESIHCVSKGADIQEEIPFFGRADVSTFTIERQKDNVRTFHAVMKLERLQVGHTDGNWLVVGERLMPVCGCSGVASFINTGTYEPDRRETPDTFLLLVGKPYRRMPNIMTYGTRPWRFRQGVVSYHGSTPCSSIDLGEELANQLFVAGPTKRIIDRGYIDIQVDYSS